MPMGFHFLEGNMRAEIDMAEVKGQALPSQMAVTLKQIGMDKVVTIMPKGGKGTLILYPNLKAAVTVPMEDPPDPQTLHEESVRQIKIGTETVSGRRCDQ